MMVMMPSGGACVYRVGIILLVAVPPAHHTGAKVIIVVLPCFCTVQYSNVSAIGARVKLLRLMKIY